MDKKLTPQKVDTFEKLQAQLNGLYSEIDSLSKKKPDNPINKFKLKFINELIQRLNNFLDIPYRPFAEFTQFDEDELPTNSDITVILSQYSNCMEKYRTDNIISTYGEWYWATENEDIRTALPQKLKG